jgi:hypothetical protein
MPTMKSGDILGDQFARQSEGTNTIRVYYLARAVFIAVYLAPDQDRSRRFHSRSTTDAPALADDGFASARGRLAVSPGAFLPRADVKTVNDHLAFVSSLPEVTFSIIH